jgi:hypothetical protein
MTDNDEKDRDETVPDEVPAKHPTDESKDQEKKDKDAAVDAVSEQSMDGSDAPAW